MEKLQLAQDDATLSAIGEADLRAAINLTRERGYAAVGSRITPGTGSVGVDVRGDDYHVALAVVSLTERTEGERSIWLVEEIRRLLSERL